MKIIGLLAYSPLAFGVLSGKYIEGKDDYNSRLNLFPQMARYSGLRSKKATEEYLQIAKNNGISLVQMSLAFVTQQPFVNK